MNTNKQLLKAWAYQEPWGTAESSSCQQLITCGQNTAKEDHKEIPTPSIQNLPKLCSLNISSNNLNILNESLHTDQSLQVLMIFLYLLDRKRKNLKIEGNLNHQQWKNVAENRHKIKLIWHLLHLRKNNFLLCKKKTIIKN